MTMRSASVRKGSLFVDLGRGAALERDFPACGASLIAILLFRLWGISAPHCQFDALVQLLHCGSCRRCVTRAYLGAKPLNEVWSGLPT